jgi:ketosteroid isomerase-like protein
VSRALPIALGAALVLGAAPAAYARTQAPAALPQGAAGPQTTGPQTRGPLAEIAEINRKRNAAVERGDLDVVMEDVADNVVLTLAQSGLRIEGKAAARAYLEGYYALYPGRSGFTRHAMGRVYAGGQVVVVNAYLDQMLTDRAGGVTLLSVRWSQTWVHEGGRWLLVDQHISDIPN